MLFVDGYEQCAYEAAAKIYTMVMAEDPEHAKEWVVLLVGAMNSKNNPGSGVANIRISD